jgi:chromosome segregation protein
MRLKSLDLHGFKSFADKTHIDFHEGVTAIVGPNGCGKSNVVDAVRWALGETSAKALRGGEMADVIFNGTDKRKPHSMAEVSLTFDNCETLGMEFNEVCITRRVFRDGKGEYEINGSGCRLKDINKLFMDTGVGRTAYSIMEQGKIDMLLSAKPEDRRQVFEEAAGITKSKSEKKEALRKLEYTEANLLRVTDILAEMKRQIGSMQRQANKARRYQELHRDVSVLDTHLSFRRYNEQAAEKSELETSIASLRGRQTELEDRIHEDEVQLSADRMELRELENMLTSLRHQLNDRQNHIHSAEGRIGFNGERERELENLIEQNQGDVEANTDRLSHQEEELKSADSALNAIRENIARQREQIEEHARIAQAAREEKARLERSLRDARQAMHNAESVIISAQAEIASHMSQAEAAMARQEQLQRDTEALAAERESRQREESELLQRIADLRVEMEGHELQLSQREKELQAVEIGMEQTARRLAEVSRLHSERTSRAEVLRQLIAQGEGLEKGTREVLRGLDNPEFFHNGTRGLLSQCIEVDREYIPATEAALGANLQAVLVANSLLAENIVDVLTRKSLGRALVLPEDLLRTAGGYQMLVMPDGGLAWAADVVRAQDSVRPMVQQLLANVLIVPDLGTALRLKQENPEIAFATLNGEFVSMEGTVSGGSAGENSGSLLQRQAELKELEEESARLEMHLALLEAGRAKQQDDHRTLKVQFDEQREILQSRRVEESQMQGQQSLIARELQTLVSRAEALHWEQSELARRHESVMQKNEEAVARRARAEEELESRREEASQLEANLDAAGRNENDAIELLNELRTAHAVEQRAEQAMLEQRGPMTSRVRELEEAIARRRRDIESYQERIAAARAENDRLHEEIISVRSLVEEMVQRIETQTEDRTLRLESVTGRENKLAAARREISSYADQRGREEVRATQVSLRMENLHAHTMERYRVDLNAFEQDIHALLSSIAAQKSARKRGRKSAIEEAREERAARVESDAAATTMPPDSPDVSGQSETNEIPASAEEDESPAFIAEIEEEDPADMMVVIEEEVDWAFVEASVTELRQRLDSMGPVNLDAIQEYEELEERHNFLQYELNELNNAKTELLGVIQRINDEAKKRFSETFIQVRDNFRNTFKELFGPAAQADLVLMNEEDPLESGIEVIAKPPGKKPTSITLLSGGERSMTAVALLFSIYMVKPSPFCILDELDAPLDESNIGRFLSMLDRFIEKSQFVIVTHNKRTMRRADVMYGVTMEEFGVSKPVGMKLTESEDRRAGAATRAERHKVEPPLAQTEAPVPVEEAFVA